MENDIMAEVTARPLCSPSAQKIDQLVNKALGTYDGRALAITRAVDKGITSDPDHVERALVYLCETGNWTHGKELARKVGSQKWEELFAGKTSKKQRKSSLSRTERAQLRAKADTDPDPEDTIAIYIGLSAFVAAGKLSEAIGRLGLAEECYERAGALRHLARICEKTDLSRFNAIRELTPILR